MKHSVRTKSIIQNSFFFSVKNISSLYKYNVTPWNKIYNQGSKIKDFKNFVEFLTYLFKQISNVHLLAKEILNLRYDSKKFGNRVGIRPVCLSHSNLLINPSYTLLWVDNTIRFDWWYLICKMMFQSFCFRHFRFFVRQKSQYFTTADRYWSPQIDDMILAHSNKSRRSLWCLVTISFRKFGSIGYYEYFLIRKMSRKLHRSYKYTYSINLLSFYLMYGMHISQIDELHELYT